MDNKYFAYGSNLDIVRFLSRCPEAVIIGKAELPEYRLSFMTNNNKNIVANIGGDSNISVQGVIYELSKLDKKALDVFEGFPWVYSKIQVTAIHNGSEVKCFTYKMERYYKAFYVVGKNYVNRKESRKYGVPKEDYLEYIVRGYKMFGLDSKVLKQALKFSEEGANIK